MVFKSTWYLIFRQDIVPFFAVFGFLIHFVPDVCSQQPVVLKEDIGMFASILQNQANVQPLDISDLSGRAIDIYWCYPDRRSASTLVNRLSSYVGDQNVEIRYYWNWPDSLRTGENQTNIIVYDAKDTWPSEYDQYNIYRIGIGTSQLAVFPGIQLPDAGEAVIDLAAQYMMGGIRIDADGRISTGTRVSYLPAEYLGLDGSYIRHHLDSILQLGLDSSAYPGAVVSIVYKGSVIYEKAVGYHTYNQVYRVRSHDLFDLASVTKVTAGVNSLMSMYDAGVFDLDKSLGDYFSYFRNSDKEGLSMRRILTHSAGLTPYLVYYSMARKDNGKYQSNTIAQTRHGHYNYKVTDSIYISDQFNRFIHEAILKSPLKPGNKYEYSGLFFLLIPELVKKQTGESLDDYLAENIFGPLGADHTAFNPSHVYNIHQIIPTEVDQVWRHQLVHGSVHDEAAAVLAGVSANAGLFSSAPDLVKIGETWRRNGSYGGHQFWSPETIQTFTECIYCDEGNRRSLGFDRPPLPEHSYQSYMSPLASQESFGHSGFTGTMMWVDPAVEYTFVFLSNRVHPTRENSKLYTLNIRPELHSVLYKAIKNAKSGQIP